MTVTIIAGGNQSLRGLKRKSTSLRARLRGRRFLRDWFCDSNRMCASEVRFARLRDCGAIYPTQINNAEYAQKFVRVEAMAMPKLISTKCATIPAMTTINVIERNA